MALLNIPNTRKRRSVIQWIAACIQLKRNAIVSL